MLTRISYLVICVFILLCTSITLQAQDNTMWSVSSPDQSLTISVTHESDGSLTYVVSHAAIEVVHPSRLGIVRDDTAFIDGLIFDSADAQVTIDESYGMLVGKQRIQHNHAHELTLNFHNSDDARLQIILRAYDDGVAFRYRFPEDDATQHTVTQELTTFKLSLDGRVWSQPYDLVTMWSPAYEHYFTDGADVATDATTLNGTGWAFPALFEVDQHWLLLTEADLDGTYFGAHLASAAPDGEYAIAMPLEGEARARGSIEATSTLPWMTPWRVMIVGASIETIVESSLVYHLSAPNRIADTTWIQPGHASWSWWSDHGSPRSYEELASFVDLAAEMGWEYSLVDANWNRMRGGDLEQLVAYASERGVGILLWYNSGGPHNLITEAPRDRMNVRDIRREEFAYLESIGVRGVKVDFFQSDKQEIIQLYLDILQDAADYHLLVNFHGSTIPRGWSRTYPNLMTMESVRGAEAYTFDQTYSDNAPLQNTILPFTRNVIGPMDYTPVTFTDELVPHLTTNAHELALSVVFDSGIIHMADSVEAYRSLPDEPRQFLSELPVVWDETQFLTGEPGLLVVLARRSGDEWYIGGINGQPDMLDVMLDLSFLGDGDFTAMIIQDGADRLSFESHPIDITLDEPMYIRMQPYGGFVMRISPAP